MGVVFITFLGFESGVFIHLSIFHFAYCCCIFYFTPYCLHLHLLASLLFRALLLGFLMLHFLLVRFDVASPSTLVLHIFLHLGDVHVVVSNVKLVIASQ